MHFTSLKFRFKLIKCLIWFYMNIRILTKIYLLIKLKIFKKFKYFFVVKVQNGRIDKYRKIIKFI